MTEVVKPPIVPTKDPINEGVQARLRHFREVANAFCSDLREMERLEKALLAALDRLDRHTYLMSTETQLLEQLLKREAVKQAAARPVSLVGAVDHVEEALATLTGGLRTEKAS